MIQGQDRLPAIGRRGPPLLIVLGFDGEARESARGGFHVGGNSDIYQLIPETIRFDQLNLGKRFLKAGGRPNPALYPCVLNLVTDPDQHPQTLERVRKLLRGYKGRLINRPEAVQKSTRDQVARRLAGVAGLRVPRLIRLRSPKPGAATVAVGKSGQAFPLIVRLAGTHTGKIVALVDSAAELEAAVAGPGDYIVIEFVDFRSGDGLFRKYRFWSLGGRTIFRHMIVSDDWNVHVSERLRFMVGRPDLMEEEVRLLSRPGGAFPQSVHDTFDAVKKRMGLDFFGMDFAFDRDGGLILFEANSTMNFFPLEPHLKFSYLGKIRGPAQQAFSAMLGFGGESE